MTRRQSGILALLQRGPMTTSTLASALEARMADVATDLNRLSAAGKVEHTGDGWQLVEEKAA